jgi:hypothetical protein
MIPFLVCGFGKSTLSNLIKECFGSDFPDIFHKKQIDYIFRYLKDLGAVTIILEFEYVDKDYLDDFAKFYIRRFNSNGHKCARLHFFSAEFDHATLNEYLIEKPLDDLSVMLQTDYLGFMVVKPLPKTFIGKTCLKQYKPSGPFSERRLLSRTYKVNLLGADLEVQSIAFQEQDKVVSACATTAIWSALQSLQWRSIREIPSCSEITTSAINFIEGSSNSFPSKELSNKQILRALDVEGLRHHTESLKRISRVNFLATVKSYIDSGLPLILGAALHQIDGDGNLIRIAGHAVTILGYKLSESEDALYVHDDRLGPYSRAKFTDLESYKSDLDGETWGLMLQEKTDEGSWKDPHEILIPEILIAATDKKVRIPLAYVENTARLIQTAHDKIWKGLEKKANPSQSLRGQLTYTVRLAEISEIKKSYFSLTPDAICKELQENNEAYEKAREEVEQSRLKFLTSSHARFQWEIDYSVNHKLAFSLLIDATDIPQGHAVSAILVKNKKLADSVLQILKVSKPSKTDEQAYQSHHSFFASFLRRLEVDEPNLQDHLNKEFGEPRAPSYLKNSEMEGGKILQNPTLKTFYEPTDRTLGEIFTQLQADDPSSFVIWVITFEGVLLIGEEIKNMGHPCLTGFKPARIAGELSRTTSGWAINSKSGRYSKGYRNSEFLLNNALKRFQSIFWNSRHEIGVAKA